jgi:hypothetical protein
MKKFIFAAMVGLATLLIISCSTKDVINDIDPMETEGLEMRSQIVDSLRKLPAEERGRFMEQNAPQLNSMLTSYLRQRGYSCEIKTIGYGFGSGKAKGVESGDGNRHNGHYNDQLYAIVKGGKCFDDSLIVFVQCLNGTFSLKGDGQSLGTYVPEFTIDSLMGINRYVDYPTSIYLAEYFNIPIYRGKKMAEKFRITPAEARLLEGSIGNTQITVKVYPGDHFHLGTMTYTRSF